MPMDVNKMVETDQQLEVEVERLRLRLAEEQASHRKFRAEMFSDPGIKHIFALHGEIGFMQLIIDGYKLGDEEEIEVDEEKLDEMMEGKY
jgi:regulator of replication initiation timing